MTREEKVEKIVNVLNNCPLTGWRGVAEAILHAIGCDEKPDPMQKYFVPGQVFEVWNDGKEHVYRTYMKHIYEKPFFIDLLSTDNLYKWDNYKPIGTIWDSPYTPDWVMWVQVKDNLQVDGYDYKDSHGLFHRYVNLGLAPKGTEPGIEQRPEWARSE